jgi:AbrB family looped-hinge helix DNA binding protein
MASINLQVGKNGRVVIPISLRQTLHLGEGDTLVATVEGHRLILETEAALIERLYETVGPAAEGELVSEELIRERREEAKREQAELEA